MWRKRQKRVESPWTDRPECRIPLPSGRVLDAGPRPLVMGILNVTPDSFSDGGEFEDAASAVDHARRLCAEGADIVDVGGESTRPGSEPVPADEERGRVVPVISQVAAEMDVPISIDTQKAAVAEAALDAGAEIVNDVSALRSDLTMAGLAAKRGVPVVLMHMQGTPRTMQKNPTYEDVVKDVIGWLRERIRHATAAGIKPDHIIVDPGFGFGKTVAHNLELLQRLHELHELGHPVMIGTSRKSTLGKILDADVCERLHGTLATVASAVMAGCQIIRCHDVRPALEVVKVCEAIRRGSAYGDV